jgi:ribonuclease VapC
MSSIVFDSSVLIAILRQEPGYEQGEALFSKALVSTVNLAEVSTYLARNGASLETIKKILEQFPCQIIDFSHELVAMTGFLYQQAKQFGLSLGDRACLALAMSKNIPVLTADTIWTKLSLSIDVKTIR